MKFDRILWIRNKNDNSDSKPIAVGIVGDRMHWHCGITRCNWEPEKYQIIREYAPEDVDKALDELDEEFFPKPQAPCARLGLVSPEGYFYPCGYCCHNDLERTLGIKIYDNPYPMLREKGWIEIKSGALICVKEGKVTQDAKDTVRKIVEAFEIAEAQNPDINWTRILWDNPEGYHADTGWSDPANLGYLPSGDTYAQALRSTYELYFGDGDFQKRWMVPPSFGDNIKVKRPGEHPGD